MRPNIFKHLSPKENAEFRQWARDNPPEVVLKTDQDRELANYYHPVVRDEWQRMAKGEK
jgi:hypothetical protein